MRYKNHEGTKTPTAGAAIERCEKSKKQQCMPLMYTLGELGVFQRVCKKMKRR